MRPALALVASLFALAALAEGPVPVGPRLSLVKARPAQSTAKEVVTGALFPSRLQPLGFELGGRLASTRVKKGELVRAGQLLGSLDTEIVDAQVAQAEAGLAAAEAGAALATDVAGRNEKLKAEGSVSEVQLRSADTQSKQAQAQVLVARAALAQARAARRRHDLRALYGGTVVDAPDNAGGMVGPGTPVYVVMDLSTLILKTTIPENVRAQVAAGLRVQVESVGAPVSTDEAKVKVVIPSADPQTRRVPIEVEVPNAAGRFVANTLARVTLPLGKAQPSYQLPASALGSTGGEHVFVLDGRGLLQRVPVAVVERGSREVTVTCAFPLDQVVDYPSSSLVEGAKP